MPGNIQVIDPGGYRYKGGNPPYPAVLRSFERPAFLNTTCTHRQALDHSRLPLADCYIKMQAEQKRETQQVSGDGYFNRRISASVAGKLGIKKTLGPAFCFPLYL